MLDWLDTKGAEFITTHREFGKSTEEVEKLIEECKGFDKEELEPVTLQVEKLQKMMKEFEEMGHYELNRIRSIGNHLQKRWDRFETDKKTYDTNLQQSQEFHVILLYTYAYIIVNCYPPTPPPHLLPSPPPLLPLHPFLPPPPPFPLSYSSPLLGETIRW